MKQYVIDQLRLEDYHALKTYLDENLGAPDMGGIYWMPLAPELMTDHQRDHADCHPLCLALELEEDRLSCELLVRTKNRIRCACIAYATPTQRAWLMDCVDAIFEKLRISV